VPNFIQNGAIFNFGLKILKRLQSEILISVFHGWVPNFMRNGAFFKNTKNIISGLGFIHKVRRHVIFKLVIYVLL